MLTATTLEASGRAAIGLHRLASATDGARSEHAVTTAMAARLIEPSRTCISPNLQHVLLLSGRLGRRRVDETALTCGEEPEPRGLRPAKLTISGECVLASAPLEGGTRLSVDLSGSVPASPRTAEEGASMSRRYCWALAAITAVSVYFCPSALGSPVAGSSPSARAAAPYWVRLGIFEARVQLWRWLQRDFEYGTVDGSDSFYCYRRSRQHVTCGLSFRDLDGDTWCGTGNVTEHVTHYSLSRRLSTECYE